MLKKVTILVGVLMLLPLATAQLALAQQDGGIYQTVRDAQVASPDTAQQDQGTETQGAENQSVPAPSNQNVWRVSIQDFSFDPADAAIDSGDQIMFVNEGNEPHTVTADDGQFDSGQLNPGESVTVSFEGSGTLTYHCEIHPSMVGSVTVGGESTTPDEASTPAAPTEGGGMDTGMSSEY